MKSLAQAPIASRHAPQHHGLGGPAFVKSLQEGDAEALGSFFDSHFDKVYAFIHRQVHHDQLAEDLTQDVFLNFHRSTDRLDPTRKLEPWLFTIAVNRLRDHWRSASYRSTEPNQDAEGNELDYGLTSDEDLPSAQIEESERSGALHSAIQELPESLRSTLKLRAMDGLPFGRIAEIIGRNEVAVRKRYSRAVSALRDILPKDEAELGNTF